MAQSGAQLWSRGWKELLLNGSSRIRILVSFLKLSYIIKLGTKIVSMDSKAIPRTPNCIVGLKINKI